MGDVVDGCQHIKISSKGSAIVTPDEEGNAKYSNDMLLKGIADRA